MADRIEFSRLTRAGVETLVRGYATSVALRISFYRGRPQTVTPPHAFIDRLDEAIAYVGPTNIQRTVTAHFTVLWGTFDSGDAVDQRDRFVDGFVNWITEHADAIHPNTEVRSVSASDDPVYRPEWLEEGPPYFATTFQLEGYAET